MRKRDIKMMRVTFLFALIALTIFPGEKCKSYNLNDLHNYSAIRRLLKEWNKQGSHIRRLTIVFDDYSGERADIPVSLLGEFYGTTTLVTVKHLIYLDSTRRTLDYHVVETGNCILLVSPNILRVRQLLLSRHLWSFWQPENFYIVWEVKHGTVSVYDESYRRFLEWALERVWRFRRIYKIVVCIGDKFVSYDPFKYENHFGQYLRANACKKGCNKYVRKSYSILSIHDSRTADVSRYVRTSRDTFDLYPLKISVFEATTMIKTGNTFSGVDMQFAMIMCQMMNVTPMFLENKDKFGWKANGKFYGALGDIVYKRAEVTFNEFFVKHYSTRHIERMAPITDDVLCLLVPRAKPIPEYLLILRTFTGSSWAVIFLGYVVISMIYIGMRPTVGEMNYQEKAQQAEVFDILREHKEQRRENRIRPELSVTRSRYRGKSCAAAALLRIKEETEGRNGSICTEEGSAEPLGITGDRCSGEVYRGRSRRLRTICRMQLISLSKYLTKVILQILQPLQPAPPRVSERSLVMCSLTMSLILNGVFTSKLTSSFSKLVYFPNVHTLQEVDDAGFDVIATARDIMEDAFGDTENPLLRSLHSKMRYENQERTFQRLADGEHVAVLQRKATIPLKFTKSQRDGIHVVEECPKPYLSGHLVAKGSPFFSRMNTIVGRLNNGGFYKKWFRDMTQTSKPAADEEAAPEVHLSLNMKHFLIPFVILFIGLFASTAVFVYERRETNIETELPVFNVK